MGFVRLVCVATIQFASRSWADQKQTNEHSIEGLHTAKVSKTSASSVYCKFWGPAVHFPHKKQVTASLPPLKLPFFSLLLLRNKIDDSEQLESWETWHQSLTFPVFSIFVGTISPCRPFFTVMDSAWNGIFPNACSSKKGNSPDVANRDQIVLSGIKY